MVNLDSDHVYQPSDAFFKQCFSDPRLAKSFFQAYVPEDLLASIDLDYISLLPQTLVDAMMKELRADVIYKVQFKKDRQDGYMIFSIEHQSTSLPLMLFRMLRYGVHIIEQLVDIKKDTKIPLVYGIVVYNGERPYNHTIDVLKCVDVPDRSLAENYFLKTHLIDLTSLPEVALKNHALSSAMELALKCIHTKEQLTSDSMNEMLLALKEQGEEELLQRVLYYIFSASPFNKEEIKNYYVQQMDNRLGDIIMSAQHNFMQECLHKGLEQGRIEGLEEGALEGERQVLIRLLNRKFGSVPSKYIAKLNACDSDTLLDLGEKLLDSNSIQEVFSTVYQKK